MASKNFWLGILVMVLVFGMVLIGCDDGNGTGTGNGNDNGNNTQIIITVTGISDFNGVWGQLWLSTNMDGDFDGSGGAEADVYPIQDGQATFALVLMNNEVGWTDQPFNVAGQYYVFMQLGNDEENDVGLYFVSKSKINIVSGNQNIVFSDSTFSPHTF